MGTSVIRPLLAGTASVLVMGTLSSVGAQSLEATADGAVDEAVADAHLDPAKQLGVDDLLQLDGGAGHGDEPLA